MRAISATEASRNFKKLLDAVESGEHITITRGGEAIAEIAPLKRRTAKELFDALDRLDLPPMSDEEYRERTALLDELRTPDPDFWNAPWMRP